jgi:hypothetical protein
MLMAPACSRHSRGWIMSDACWDKRLGMQPEARDATSG